MSKTRISWPWSVPLAVADIPAEGHRHQLVADAAMRAAIAKLAGLIEIECLEADILLTVPHDTDGVRVTGQVSASISQTCVVTLEPMQSEVTEAIDLLYLRDPPDAAREKNEADEEPGKIADERIETLQGGTIDLGAIATEFLILGLDPYPRKPGAVFAAPAVEPPPSSPFAVLEALKKASGHSGG